LNWYTIGAQLKYLRKKPYGNVTKFSTITEESELDIYKVWIMDIVIIQQQRFVFALSARRAALHARDIIKTDISRHLVLKDLARKTTTNECTLKKEFKKLFNITVYQYLLQCRMHHAGKLLQNTLLPVKGIAIECGYQTTAGFINSFKRYYGVSPGQLRRKNCSAA